MYKQVNSFDTNNKKRIYNLLTLKGETLIKGDLLALNRGLKYNEQFSNFFTEISTQIDILLIYFINDEISASLHDRANLSLLIEELTTDYYIDEDFKILEVAKEDLKDLFANRTNFIIGSNFFDFTVNTYSVFEYNMSILYENLILKYPRSNKKEKKLIELIKKYTKNENSEEKQVLLEKIKKINFYISSSEKIEYVLSKSLKTKDELKKIKEFIIFYRNQRNTIHNLGINKGKSESLIVNDIKMQMETEKPLFTENYNSVIYACRELVSIYESILFDITEEIIF